MRKFHHKVTAKMFCWKKEKRNKLDFFFSVSLKKYKTFLFYFVCGTLFNVTGKIFNVWFTLSNWIKEVKVLSFFFFWRLIWIWCGLWDCLLSYDFSRGNSTWWGKFLWQFFTNLPQLLEVYEKGPIRSPKKLNLWRFLIKTIFPSCWFPLWVGIYLQNICIMDIKNFNPKFNQP